MRQNRMGEEEEARSHKRAKRAGRGEGEEEKAKMKGVPPVPSMPRSNDLLLCYEIAHVFPGI